MFILGTGFDPNGLLNLVTLGDSINCPINNYFTTDTTLVCELPYDFYPLATYEVKVRVGSTTMACNSPCTVNMNEHTKYTPKTRAVYPSSVFPGDFIGFAGWWRLSTTNDLNDVKIGDYTCETFEEPVGWSVNSFFRCQTGVDIKAGMYETTVKGKIQTGYS